MDTCAFEVGLSQAPQADGCHVLAASGGCVHLVWAFPLSHRDKWVAAAPHRHPWGMSAAARHSSLPLYVSHFARAWR